MAKKQLYEMTNGEKFKHYKKNSRLALAGKWASIITPFGVIFGVKFNEYFTIVDQGESVKLTIGCVLALIVAGIACFNEIKKGANKHIAPVAGWGLAFAFTFLFYSILKDLLLIVGAEFAGQAAAAGLNYYADYCSSEAEEYKKLARQDNTLSARKPETKSNVSEETGTPQVRWF